MGLLGGSKFVLQGKWAVTARCGGVRAPRPTVGRSSGYKGVAAGRRGRRPLQLKDKAVLRAPCGQIERGKGERQSSPDSAGGAEPRPYGHPIPTAGGRGAWRRTTSAASQQSWPARAVACPAGASIAHYPSFAPLNCGPSLATPQPPNLRWSRVRGR